MVFFYTIRFFMKSFFMFVRCMLMNQIRYELIEKPSGSFSQTIKQDIIQFKVTCACQMLQCFYKQGNQETDKKTDVPFTCAVPYDRKKNPQRKQHEHIFVCKPGMPIIDSREQNKVDNIFAADFPGKKGCGINITTVHTQKKCEDRRPPLLLTDNGIQKVTEKTDASCHTCRYQVIFPQSYDISTCTLEGIGLKKGHFLSPQIICRKNV